jgi:hypothetical protein
MIGQKSTSFYSNCENYKNKEHFNLEHLFLISNTLNVDLSEAKQELEQRALQATNYIMRKL